MSNNLQNALYPLGYIPAILFSLRFFIQWLLSEKAKKSYVNSLFWEISLIANFLLMVHSIIQQQFHMAIIQATNIVISKRNLTLLKENKIHEKFSTIIMKMVLINTLVLVIFCAREIITPETSFWFGNIKNKAIISNNLSSIIWHIFGTISILLFAARFWIQWILSEKHLKSKFNINFWYISLLGSILATIYFSYLHDYANILAYSLGIIPYFRNIVLIKREKSYG